MAFSAMSIEGKFGSPMTDGFFNMWFYTYLQYKSEKSRGLFVLGRKDREHTVYEMMEVGERRICQ